MDHFGRRHVGRSLALTIAAEIVAKALGPVDSELVAPKKTFLHQSASFADASLVDLAFAVDLAFLYWLLCWGDSEVTARKIAASEENLC